MTDRRHDRMVRTALAVVFVVLPVSSRCALGQQGGEDPFESARLCVTTQMQRRNVSSMSVAVARDGEVVWEQSFGLANREEEIEATPHTMYRLASITKVMTATALMILVERGAVELSNPVEEYLGGLQLRPYAGEATGATIERILHHTSGLPPYWSHYWEGELADRPDLREMIRRYGILVYPPGERFLYTSNLGFGIVEYIIERVSGMSYADFMRSEVFEPLGLDRTAVITEPYDEAYIAREYAGDGSVFPFYEMGSRGSNSVFASAHDLVRFGMFHLKQHLAEQTPILSDASIDLMQDAADPVSRYRLAWAVEESHGYTLVRHGGASAGTRTSLWLVPAEGLVIAILANGDQARTPAICNCIMAGLFPKYRASMLRGGATSTPAAEPTQPPSRVSLVGVWEGEIATYEGSVPVRLTVEENLDAFLSVVGVSSTDERGVRFQGNRPGFHDGTFWARFPIQIPTPDAARYADHWMYVNLWLKGRKLSGYALAESEGYSYNLPSYVELDKVE